MVKHIVKSIARNWKKTEKDDGKPVFTLNKDALTRLERLKGKVRTLDDCELVALSLKCLEHKTDRIIKRQVTKKAKALKDEGFSLQQIADILNDEDVPAIMERDKWHAEDISGLLDKLRKWDFDDTVRNNQPPNDQGLQSYEL